MRRWVGGAPPSLGVVLQQFVIVVIGEVSNTGLLGEWLWYCLNSDAHWRVFGADLHPLATREGEGGVFDNPFLRGRDSNAFKSAIISIGLHVFRLVTTCTST